MYRDRIFEHTEDQTKITLPLNRISETIEYNKRVIIDAFVETEPRCWRVTKVNRIMPAGVNRITFYQAAFDPNTDYIERDKEGKIVGFWADYYSENKGVPAQDANDTSALRGEIKYSGTKAQVKLGGGFKKLSVSFYDGDKAIDHQYGQWQFYIDGVEQSKKLDIRTAADSQDVGVNEVKIKFPNEGNKNDSFLGKTLHIVYESVSGLAPVLDMDIIGL